MAIYSFHVQVISRAEGRSSVAAAAYRSGGRLYDAHTGLSYDYTHKEGVAHTEILAPEGAPEWVHDRSVLWNTVEAVEVRKDAQLAREIMIALPVELSKDEQIELLRDYAAKTFVAQGMIVDFAVHLDNPENPHAHLMLTTREITEEGFGLKQRDWNAKAELLAWRETWAECANEHLALAGFDVRIDARTLAEQGIALTPGRKIGLSLERQAEPDLSDNLARRVAESRAIAASNGMRILETPTLALEAMTRMQASFTERDIARYLNGKTDGAEQFQAAYLKVTTSPELVRLGLDDFGRARFTTREMLGLEQTMLERSGRMAGLDGHRVSERHRAQVLAEGKLSAEQRNAFEHVTGGTDLSVVVGVAGSGKSTLLESARRAWEAEGFQVKGAALAGIAAENLESASGIPSRTLASWTLSWENGRDLLGKSDVLVIDEAGLIGTRQLSRVLEAAEQAQAKVVLIGDPEQLQAIEAGAAFRGIAAEVGPVAELHQVRRQRESWQQEATRDLARGETGKALEAYVAAGLVRGAPTRDAAREALLGAWWEAGQERPGASRLMLAYTREDVRALNEAARDLRQKAGELGIGEVIETDRGARTFAAGDRIYFLRNERSLGVKNGSLGTVEQIRDGTLQVRLDGPLGAGEPRRVRVETRDYAHLDHGYAATVHKAQGATVDRTFVLATDHFDRHATYVALSRHRDSAAMFYGEADFTSDRDRRSAAERFQATLSRARPKELAHDYLESREPASTAERGLEVGLGLERDPGAPQSLEEIQRVARQNWAAYRAAQLQREALDIEQGRDLDRKRELVQTPKLTLEETRARARENWAAYRAEQLEKERAKAAGIEKDSGLELGKDDEKAREKDKTKDLGKESEGFGLDFDP
jgi:Ti-type conjugative transfer relaxase TraA